MYFSVNTGPEFQFLWEIIIQIALATMGLSTYMALSGPRDIQFEGLVQERCNSIANAQELIFLALTHWVYCGSVSLQVIIMHD